MECNKDRLGQRQLSNRTAVIILVAVIVLILAAWGLAGADFSPLPSQIRAFFDNLLQFIKSSLVILIAITTTYIAYEQWRTNHLRLKHDRFESRFRRFEAIRKFLQHLIINEQVDEDTRIQFLADTSGSRFIFNAKVGQFLDDLHDKAVDVDFINTELKSCPEKEKASKLRQRTDLKKWFIAELRGLDGRFSRFF